ncbi:MAG: response regulator transcription factor [Acidimicrobiales bacterium]
MESKPTVVLADDDPIVLLLVEIRLTERGYHVLTATSGTAALELIRVSRPNAAVLDWMMPDLAGPDVCTALKSSDDTADIPIVILTAKTMESDITTGFDAGADEYLTKPFDIQELDAILRRVIGVHDE